MSRLERVSILWAAGAMLVLAPAAEAQRNESPVIVPMASFFGKPVIDLKLNGRGPYSFIVDTGASVTVLDQGLISELNLTPLGRVRVGDPANPEAQEAEEYVVEQLEMGALEFNNVEVIGMDGLGPLEELAEGPRGVLSTSIFSPYLTTLDFPSGQITLVPGALPEPDGRDVLILQEGDLVLPTVTVGIGAETLSLHLDSGSPSVITLPERFVTLLPLKSTPAVVGMARLAGGTYEIRSAQLSGQARIGRHVLEDPRVNFVAMPVGNLGMGFLRDFAITLDQQNGRIRFTRGSSASDAAARWETGPVRVARVAPAQGTRKRYGIRFLPGAPDEMKLLGVDVGSPAAAAGLCAGDVIFEINGTPCSQLNDVERAGLFRNSPLTVTLRRGDEVLAITMSLDD